MGVISRKISKICGIAVFATLILCLGALILPTMLVKSASAVRDTVHDAMNINVLDQCTMQVNATGEPADESKTFTGDATVVGAEVTLYSDGVQNSAHNFEVFCNARSGYTIKGEATDLVPTSASVDATIPFNISSDYFRTGTASNWTAIVTGLDDDSSDKIKTPRSDPDYDGIIFRSNGIEVRDFGVSYAVYVGTEAVSATYAGDATFTMAALPDPVPELKNGMSMKSVTAEMCANTPVTTPGNEFQLVDSRTGASYLVSKLEDGNCWMAQNLWLPGEMTLTSADSDISEGYTYTLPAAGTDGYTSADTNVARMYSASTTVDGKITYTTGTGGHIDNQHDTTDTNTGAFFSWMAATAGSGNYYGETDLVRPTTPGGTQASDSVCPKGWKLPTGGGTGQFKALYTNSNYNSYDNFKDNAWPHAFVGYCNSSSCTNNRGSYAYWWSSTQNNSSLAHRLLVNSSTFAPAGDNNKYIGFAVRCVLVGANSTNPWE